MLDENEESLESRTWPSFVDVLASTILVLAFAILLLVIIISIQSPTKSINNSKEKAGFAQTRVESTIISEYKAQFQRLAIIANPSLRESLDLEQNVPQAPAPATLPQYVDQDAVQVSDIERVVQGDDTRQIIGDVEKRIDTNSLEVLQELVIVQKDVVEQQRKVIEQLNKDVQDTTREYQSLLSLYTNQLEIEDVRQDIEPKTEQAFFEDPDIEGQELSGPSLDTTGTSSFFLTPPNVPLKALKVETSGTSVSVIYNDNSSLIRDEQYDKIRDAIAPNLALYKEGVSLQSVKSSTGVSEAEKQKIAVERMLLIRSILIGMGVPKDKITLEPVISAASSATSRNGEEGNGFVFIEAGS